MHLIPTEKRTLTFRVILYHTLFTENNITQRISHSNGVEGIACFGNELQV